MKNTELRRRKNRLFIATFFVLLSYSPFAFGDPINFVTPAGSLPNGSAVPPAPYGFQLVVSGNTAGQGFQLKMGSGPLPGGLQLDPTSGLIHGTPAAPTAGKDFTFTIQVSNNSGGFDERIFSIHIIRLPIDLMIVLDKSGSMSSSFDGSNGSAPVGSRRWDGLATGVGVMVTSLKNRADVLSNDRIGLRYFESGVTIPNGAYIGGIIPMTNPNLDSLNASVLRNGPGSNTALGDGIVAGKDLILPGTAGNHKAMIVLSDGLQNSGHLVTTTGANAYKQTDAGTPLSTTATDTCIISTICLNTSGDNPITMQAIADNNGPGEYFNGTVFDNNDFTMNSFLGQIQNLLSGNSPAYVDVRSGQFKADSASQSLKLQETFTVNKSVSNVFVALAAADALSPTFTSVLKDGQELIQYIHVTSGPGYRTFSINLPIPSLPAVKPEGDWKITVAGSGSVLLLKNNAATGAAAPPTSYTISMTVEDHLNHLGFSLNRDLKVGGVLQAAVTINRGTIPLSTANIQALVLKPGDDINDLIARSNVKYTVTPGDSSTPNVYKLAELLKDSAFLAKMKSLDKLVTLTYQAGTKNYTGSYSELDVAGVYRIIYNISNSDTNGVIKRYYLKSFNVRFKDVDLAASGVTVTIDSLTQNTVIIFRPVSSTGKLIGSGWGGSIGLQAQTAGLKIQRVEDLGDGTYKLHLSGPLSGDGVLTIGKDTVYNGNLGDITKGGGGGNGGGGGVFGHWWFWALLILILLLIIWASRKKQP